MKKYLKAFCAFAVSVIAAWGLFTSCGEVEPPVVEPTYEFNFEGEITLNEIFYTVTIQGEDGNFELKANALPPVKGTYTKTEGQGYTLSFQDSLATDVRTQYDRNNKEFYFIYNLDLGTARGNGNIRFTYKDESFVPAEEAWEDIPSFTGTVRLVVSATMQVVCKGDGTFRLFSTDFADYIPELTGTYEYKDGSYIFTAEGVEYVSVLNEETGLHEIGLPAGMPAFNFYATANLTQVVLTVD